MRTALRRLASFLAQLARAQHRDQLLVRAGALAYSTLVSIVPLLTVVLVMLGRGQPERAATLVGAIATVLPFSPTRVQATLTALAQRTAALGWVAVALSVVVTFNAFWQIEEVINSIWGLSRSRRWSVRLVSFATLLLTGPFLLTALFSGLYWLSSRPWYHMVVFLARPLPALLAAVTLIALYRWVPHTRVTWRAAITGGAVGAIGLTILHLTFQTYIGLASDLNVIYGSLAILLFFLISLFLFWYAILLGAEASWVVGHEAPPVRPEGIQSLINLLLAVVREGSLTTDAVVRLLGHSGPDILASLATAPAILSADGSGWRLARSPEFVTVGEVRERAGVGPAGDDGSGQDALTLAALAKQANGVGAPAAPGEPPQDRLAGG